MSFFLLQIKNVLLYLIINETDLIHCHSDNDVLKGYIPSNKGVLRTVIVNVILC